MQTMTRRIGLDHFLKMRRQGAQIVEGLASKDYAQPHIPGGTNALWVPVGDLSVLGNSELVGPSEGDAVTRPLELMHIHERS
jgi:hypothetical protein